MMATGRSDWHHALPLNCLHMNRAPHGTLGRSISPHFVFFGRPPRFNLENTPAEFHLLAEAGDDMDDEQINQEWIHQT